MSSSPLSLTSKKKRTIEDADINYDSHYQNGTLFVEDNSDNNDHGNKGKNKTDNKLSTKLPKYSNNNDGFDLARKTHHQHRQIRTAVTGTAQQQQVEIITLASLISSTLGIGSTIFNLLDQDSKIEASAVSKQFNKESKGSTIDNPNFGIFELKASKSTTVVASLLDRTDHFLDIMHDHMMNENTHNRLQKVHRVKVNDVNKFRTSVFNLDLLVFERSVINLMMEGVVSLDIIPSTVNNVAPRLLVCDTLPLALSYMFPNLHELNFTRTKLEISALERFSKQCPHLKKVVWNNNNGEDCGFYANGNGLQSSATTLKEMYMDDCCFLYNIDGMDKKLMMDHSLNNFLFNKCCGVLERLSIRNSSWKSGMYVYGNKGPPPVDIPQEALMKFVRCSPPTLKWFRSNLTQENIAILKSIRPNIDLVN